MPRKLRFNFNEFYTKYIERLKWQLPDIQLQTIDFLDDEDNWDNDTKALLIWRNFGKSTIVGAFVAYLLAKDPTLRILILSADKMQAKKTVRHVRNIIRTHPYCKDIDPDACDLPDQSDQFFVNGYLDERSPSLSAYGIKSNVTGTRADYIIYDDVEVRKNCGSEHKREELREALQESKHLLSTEVGRCLFVGTYHDYESIYDEERSNGAAYLKVPVITEPEGNFPNITGIPSWPERFPIEKVLGLQRNAKSINNFYSQYLLEPRAIDDSRLEVNRVIRYGEEFEMRSVNRSTFAKIGNRTVQSVTAWWDPAFSEASPDDSVISAVYSDDQGNYFIHRCRKLSGNVDMQCIQVKNFCLELGITLVHFEKNGVGQTLEHMLIKHISKAGIGVEGHHVNQNKNEKIIEAFEVPLSAGLLYAHESVMATKFATQMRDFNPTTTRQKDDFIDSVASAILQEPIRVASNPILHEGSPVESWSQVGVIEMPQEHYVFE